MCGIAGVLSPSDAESGRRVVEQANERQASRGPDHQALESIRWDGFELILGHSRLEIVDLTPGSHQPLWDRTGRVCIVFNGEIYNYPELRAALLVRGHSFETKSDTEVILEAYKAWGPESFTRLSGMFAFALFDRESGVLQLVRDRFGVKPLYYLIERDRVYFASTADAIARPLGLPPDLAYVSRGLHFWVYDDGEQSPYLGVRALSPGHALEVRRGDRGGLHTEMRRYYSLHDRVRHVAEGIARMSEREMIEQFASVFDRAVNIRMRTDVSIGVTLSGGLDSATVSAMALARGPVVGFTFGHPHDHATEGRSAEAVGHHTGLQLHYVHPTVEEVTRAYFACIEAQGAPFPAASVVGQYLVYQAAHREGVRVTLGGQGGDEAFMGYRKYQIFHLRRLLSRGRLDQALGFFVALLPDLIADLPRASAYWRYRHRYTHASGIASGLRLPPPDPVHMGMDLDRPLWERQALDVLQTSLPTLLRYEDRNSMAHSVESRLPFLDHSLVEFALALPDSLKLRDGRRKWILHHFARGLIPESIRVSRIKRGFDVGQDEWLGHGLAEAIRRALLERRQQLREYLEPGAQLGEMFSDTRLRESPSAFAEATTLLWLAGPSTD
jgi:asparagine synthase (glutamine-hydrolysing)